MTPKEHSSPGDESEGDDQDEAPEYEGDYASGVPVAGPPVNYPSGLERDPALLAELGPFLVFRATLLTIRHVDLPASS